MTNRGRRRGVRGAARGTRGTARWRRAVALTACGTAVAGLTSGCFAEPSAMPTVRDFLIAWQVGNYQAAAHKTFGADQKTVQAALGQVRSQLDAASLKLGLGRIDKKGDHADVRFSVRIDLGENGQPWTYSGLMKLQRKGGNWKVLWDPSIVHPSLKPGQRLAVITEVPARAEVKDAQGRSLQKPVNAAIVGVYPGRLSDPERTIQSLARATKIDGGRRLDVERLLGRVRSAPPDKFLPLLTLERGTTASDPVARFASIPGLVVQQRQLPIGAAAAPEVVGNLGPATADRLQQVGAPYQPGDTIGVSGLQMLQQRRLAGIPVVKVVAQDPDGKNREELHSWDGVGPQPVQTTLDRKVQGAADRTLAGLPFPASLVAIQAGTGNVLAVSNHNTGGQNLAMEGHYPPGLTFGIVSGEALLEAGTSKDTPTDCPATANVGGQTFTSEYATTAKRTLEKNFAYSCATTMAKLSGNLPPQALTKEAANFGLGKDWGLSVPAFTGSVPTPTSDAEKATTMIGQGKVQVSPLSMALAAGGAKTGLWRPPVLLQTPADPQTTLPQVLSAPATAGMNRMMQRSVFEGTAKAAGKGVKGSVIGVAATVNYPERGRTRTISWFVGVRDTLAFAIAVEGDVPASTLAARFLGAPASRVTPTAAR
ncbi:NTF2 domain-containing protein transpeptidase [Actinomadura barringtoniae]|uniref:NTF2 domain-containing protein transpeptidase n=1 Tax=Actinomadura barringtoniae TaxID=1427535 RepID=A0A939PDZ8_9ACTN|nr:penicillin-binding transpeptidase domain-containing protein [Actinomadura barringtoniae]MBO2448353.1 NTF2 domain-containing protein transpeptidase [Actinomadura barringtoniae]